MSEQCIKKFRKDLNTTFSFIYSYFLEYIKKALVLQIQCDNYPGANKNNYLL